MRASALLVAAFVALSAPAGAVDLDLGAPEGAERTAYQVQAFDRYDLPTGPVGRVDSVLTPVQGRVVWSAYRLGADAAWRDVLATYHDRLEELGFETAFACETEACGGFDFRFGVTILPGPAMRMDVQAFGQISAVRSGPEAYASILVSEVQGAVFVQTVAVTPAEGEAVVVAAPAPEDVVQESVGPGDIRALGDLLRANGHVTIEGLEFATGGAALLGDSDTALEGLARVLTRDSDLSIAIVGHSDNQGDLQTNIDLSQRRAEAVMAALIDRGVPEVQLEARGIGYLAPLTTNETEEGRKMNRRVELVLR